jgi:hypothetical protein
VDKADDNDITKEMCMRAKQPTGKAAWWAGMLVALVAMGCSTTMFARQTDDPIEAQAVVLENGINEQAVQIAEPATEVPAAGEDQMDADSPAPEASAADNATDTDTEEASAADNATDTDTEEASAAENMTDNDTEEASAADNMTDTVVEQASTADDMADMDMELASAADDTPDAETEGVSPETGNP